MLQWTLGWMCLQIMVFFGYMPRSGIARSCSRSIFRFLRNLRTALHSVAPAYVPTNSIGGFPFLHTLASVYFVWRRVCVCVCHFWHMELSGQGSDWSHSLNLSHRCGNTGSLTHCAGQGSNPRPRGSQDAADPIVPHWELMFIEFLMMAILTGVSW